MLFRNSTTGVPDSAPGRTASTTGYLGSGVDFLLDNQLPSPSVSGVRVVTAAVIDPPETLEIRFSCGGRPSWFSRHSAPTWNSMAR
jgi:hypothetical protein